MYSCIQTANNVFVKQNSKGLCYEALVVVGVCTKSLIIPNARSPHAAIFQLEQLPIKLRRVSRPNLQLSINGWMIITGLYKSTQQLNINYQSLNFVFHGIKPIKINLNYEKLQQASLFTCYVSISKTVDYLFKREFSN